MRLDYRVYFDPPSWTNARTLMAKKTASIRIGKKSFVRITSEQERPPTATPGKPERRNPVGLQNRQEGTRIRPHAQRFIKFVSTITIAH